MAHGITLCEAQVIPDIEDVLVDRIRFLRARYDYVLTTGGIGPTHDDITAACIAKAFDVPLVVDQTIASRIQQRPAEPAVMRNRLLMARVPEGSELIENSTGGPQGFQKENVYAMAGIPVVLKNMLPNIELRGGSVVQSQSIRVYLGESAIAEELGDIQEQFPMLDIGSYPFKRRSRYGTVLVVRGTELETIQQACEMIKAMIVKRGKTPYDVV